MLKKIKSFFLNRETVLYLAFGILTSLISIVTYGITLRFYNSFISNIISFIPASIFAYVVNKIFVFKSLSWKPRILLKEIPSFFGARIFSFLFEQFGIFLFGQVLNFEDKMIFGIKWMMIIKLVLTAFVVVINYVFSKLFIFAKKKNQK